MGDGETGEGLDSVTGEVEEFESEVEGNPLDDSLLKHGLPTHLADVHFKEDKVQIKIEVPIEFKEKALPLAKEIGSYFLTFWGKQ